MEDRDYRSEVGKKIEEALANGDFDLIEDLIEVPPMETFMQWAEKGEEKRKKRVCRKKILVSCVAVCVIALSAMVAVQCFNPPEVEADPDSGVDIELNDMESVVIYDSWENLPVEIKEKFIEVKNLPEEYKVKQLQVSEGETATKIKYIINNEISIRQYINIDGSLPITIITENNGTFVVGETTVYVERKENVRTTTYKCIIGNVMVDIVVPIDMEIEEVTDIIKTVQ